MLLGSIRCRALEKQRDLRRAHHLRRATEAPGTAARNAQPPVNGQAEQTTTVVTPVMSIQQHVLSQRQHTGEDVWLGERAEEGRSGGEEQAAAAARQSSRQEQKAKKEAFRALLPALDARPEIKRPTVEAHDEIMGVQQEDHARRAAAVEEKKRGTAAMEEERRAKAAAAAEAEQRRGKEKREREEAAAREKERTEREREREREKNARKREAKAAAAAEAEQRRGKERLVGWLGAAKQVTRQGAC
jgi:hypothetical protein